MALPYLDTSAVRSLGGWLDDHPGETRTSALAVAELVNTAFTGRKQFGAARGALRRVLAAHVALTWELPDAFMARAFDWVVKRCHLEERRIESLKTVARCVVDSETLEEAGTALATEKIEFGLDYWASYDDEFGQGYIEQTVAGHARLKGAFANAKATGSSQIPAEVLDRGYRAFCEWFAIEYRNVNFSATVLALGTRAALLIGQAVDERVVGAIHDSYNGSIDVFAKAFSWCSITDHRDTRRPARNDAIDLGHLLYVAEQDTLVTNDKRLLDVASVVGVNALKVTAFQASRR